MGDPGSDPGSRECAIPGAVLEEGEDRAADYLRPSAYAHFHALAASECRSSCSGSHSWQFERGPSNRLCPLPERPHHADEPGQFPVLPMASNQHSNDASEFEPPHPNANWVQDLTQGECVRRSKSSASHSVTIQNQGTPVFPGDCTVSSSRAEEGETPAFFVELQRLASTRKHAHVLDTNRAASHTRAQSAGLGRISSTMSRMSSFVQRASSHAIPERMLQLTSFPTMSNEMAEVLAGAGLEQPSGEAQLDEAGPLYKLALIPIVSFLPVFLYAIPSSWGPEARADGSIWETWVLWPPILVFTTALFPLWVHSWSGVEYRSNRAFFVYFGITWGLVGTAATLLPLWIIDVIAVPFVKICQAAVFLLYLGISVFFGMKPEQRRQRHLFRKAATGLTVAMSVIVVFAFLYPVLNIAFLKAESALVQFGIAIVFWGLTSGYVMLLNRVAKAERPDMLPVIAYLAVFFYNFFTSASVFSAIQSWYVFVTFLLLDIGESAWLCLLATAAVARILDESAASGSDTAVVVADAEAPAREHQDVPELPSLPAASGAKSCGPRQGEVAKRCVSVLSLAVARMLAAMVAPLEYTASLVLLRGLNPRMNGAFSFLSDEEANLSVTYIVVQVVCQAGVMQVLRSWVLRRCGIDLWRIARGVCSRFFCEIVTSHWTAIMCYLALQWSPGGVDWSFKFNYLEPGAVWHGGLCWTLPGEPGEQVCDGVLGARSEY